VSARRNSLTVTTSAGADGLWALARMIADGQTWLPANPAYLWLMRFFAVSTLVYGVYGGARKAAIAFPIHS
jgi:hypothetical protein